MLPGRSQEAAFRAYCISTCSAPPSPGIQLLAAATVSLQVRGPSGTTFCTNRWGRPHCQMAQHDCPECMHAAHGCTPLLGGLPPPPPAACSSACRCSASAASPPTLLSCPYNRCTAAAAAVQVAQPPISSAARAALLELATSQRHAAAHAGVSGRPGAAHRRRRPRGCVRGIRFHEGAWVHATPASARPPACA